MTIQVCKICLIDSTIPNSNFDENGICNFCALHKNLDKAYPLGDEGVHNFDNLIKKIKNHGKGKEYDCIVGVSGGVDSSFVLYEAVKYGLRPLAVHFDNGWDTEVSVNNIQKLVKRLNVDLYTYVVKWDEFKDIQLSILKSSFPDVELPTDLGIHSVLYLTAAKNKIKYVLSGISFRTEGVTPSEWDYGDGRIIRNVQKNFGTIDINSYPLLTLSKLLKYIFINKIKIIRFLNYLDYSKNEAKEILKNEIGWLDYGGHHHESIYTRFYHEYLAPYKFNINYKIISLSAQVRTGQISKDEALSIINNSKTYLDSQKDKDFEYIAKKLGITNEEFLTIINSKPRNHSEFKSYYYLMKKLKYIIELFSYLKIIPVQYHPQKYK